MHLTGYIQRTLTFFGFFCQDVSLKGLLVGDLSGAGNFEPLFGTGVGLNFWHYFNIYFYTLLAFRTGGNLLSLVGNPAGAGNGVRNYEKKQSIPYFPAKSL